MALMLKVAVVDIMMVVQLETMVVVVEVLD
jgi:hypothetical protein